MTQEGKTLSITTNFPNNIDGNLLCEWELRSLKETKYAVVKSCLLYSKNNCEELPSCNTFTVETGDGNDIYFLTVNPSSNISNMAMIMIQKSSLFFTPTVLILFFKPILDNDTKM